MRSELLLDAPFSVIIPTYNRCNLLKLVLEGLNRQSYPDFNVIIVSKLSNDGTQDVIRHYATKLDIKVILQGSGHVTEALNLGLENATGEIIGFIDDDAIPAEDWLQSHSETYRKLDVAGVAGDVIPSRISQEGKLQIMPEQEETPFSYPFSRIGYSLWDKPLRGAEGHFLYITRGGEVASIGNMAYWRNHGIVRSFLGMGANITVRKKALEGFIFEDSWILGAGWEQLLAWYVWKKGLGLVFNPEAKVFHIGHGQSLSRELSAKKATLFQAEMELLFYRLLGKERGLSLKYRLLSIAFRSTMALKKKDLVVLRGITNGNLIGLKAFAKRKSRVELELRK